MFSKQELKDFIRVPSIFLQAGTPLPVSLYLYTPVEGKVVLLKRKSEILDMDSLLSLMGDFTSVVIALKAECEAALPLLESDFAAPA